MDGDAFNNRGENMLGLVTREPIGVVAVITPWNFPLFILCEGAPYNLAARCKIVIIPSELTLGSALLPAEILLKAGVPPGVFNVVTGLVAVVGSCLTHHDDVDMVSFTGSTEVGKGALKASAGNLKRMGRELGGKNPQVAFVDADLDSADEVVFGVAFNGGQYCVSGSRLVMGRSIADDFAG